METLALKQDVYYYGKNAETNTLLDYFQLDKREWSAVIHKADAVCRYLAAILKKGYSP